MFETETVGPGLVQKLKWGGRGGHGFPAPCPSPSGYAPAAVTKFWQTEAWE